MKNKILMLFVVLVLMASTVSAASLDLENKDGEPDWNVILNDGISGELVFNDVGQTFPISPSLNPAITSKMLSSLSPIFTGFL